MTPLLSIERLSVEYAVGGKVLSAVSDVSLEVGRGETLGLVGESGCGNIPISFPAACAREWRSPSRFPASPSS